MGQQYSHLSSEERILIEKLHCEQHLSVRKIAEEIGRDKSTVSRELRRGLWFASNENGSYRPYRPKRLKTGPWTSGPFYSALAAQRKADLRRRGSRKPRRMDSDRLRAWVLDSLRRGWSPELIEGRLKAQYAGDPSMRISHECLCQWIYAKPQRALDLRQYLARGRKRRTRKKGRKAKGPRIPMRVPIADRPEAVGSRKGFGHFECISSSRCFVFSHVFFSGLGSCMHFPYFSGCAEVFLPNMRASLTRRLWPVNSRSRPWCTMRSMIAAASLSSAKTVPHLLNSMFVVNMMLRLS